MEAYIQHNMHSIFLQLATASPSTGSTPSSLASYYQKLEVASKKPFSSQLEIPLILKDITFDEGLNTIDPKLIPLIHCIYNCLLVAFVEALLIAILHS